MIPSSIEILKYPNKALINPVFSEAASEEKLKAMEVLVRNLNAFGIASNQLGYNFCAVVVYDGKGMYTLVSPEITWMSDETDLSEEACLSLPGIGAKVYRSTSVRVRDKEGKEHLFSGLLARIVQHEVDHINGILFIDRISKLRRRLLIDKIKWLVRK